MISKKFEEFVKKWVESSAEEHCKIHKDRYLSKSQIQIEDDLWINWDDCGEREFIEDSFDNATEEEIEYYLEEFRIECLKSMGYEYIGYGVDK